MDNPINYWYQKYIALKAKMDEMMKEAVEGEVYLYHSYNKEATAIIVDIPKDKLGDKVKIIIVKEDEK